jgi:hypothetical protein
VIIPLLSCNETSNIALAYARRYRHCNGRVKNEFYQLFYKSGRLRVVIPTANFVDYDWRDIENVRTVLTDAAALVTQPTVSLGARLPETEDPHPAQLESNRLPGYAPARPLCNSGEQSHRRTPRRAGAAQSANHVS